MSKDVAEALSYLSIDIPLKCAVKRIYVSGSSVSVDVAVFAKTEDSVGEIVDRCKEIDSDRFDEDDQEIGEYEENKCNYVFEKSGTHQTYSPPSDFKNMCMMLFLGIIFIFGFILLAVKIYEIIFGK